jgi:hypothetical protein
MKPFRALFATAALVLLVGCGQDEVEPDVEPLGFDETDAERLWERITAKAPYETCAFWAGEEGVQPGPRTRSTDRYAGRVRCSRASPATKACAPTTTSSSVRSTVRSRKMTEATGRPSVLAGRGAGVLGLTGDRD